MPKETEAAAQTLGPPERFLSGRVVARQPAKGYRASIDSILLGCAIAMKPDERALEIGCGAATALLIAAWRNPASRFVGVEREEEAARLAAANVGENGFDNRVDIQTGDALAPAPDRRDAFDHVFANPPYYDDPSAIRPPADPARRAAFVTAQGGVAAWVDAALIAARTRARVTFIHRADRLDDLLAALRGRAGDIRIRPLQPRAGAAAKRVVINARKGGRAPLTLLEPLVLHESDGSLTAAAAAMVQDGAPLSLQV